MHCGSLKIHLFLELIVFLIFPMSLCVAKPAFTLATSNRCDMDVPGTGVMDLEVVGQPGVIEVIGQYPTLTSRGSSKERMKTGDGGGGGRGGAMTGRGGAMTVTTPSSSPRHVSHHRVAPGGVQDVQRSHDKHTRKLDNHVTHESHLHASLRNIKKPETFLEAAYLIFTTLWYV